MKTYPVVIIGAGMAGLSCACYLQEQAIPFIIFEASDEVGGRVRTDRVEGFLLDRGFQILLTSYPEAKKLLDYETLGLKNFRSGAIVRQNTKFNKIINPLKEPLAAFPDLFSPIGSVTDKIKILKLVTQLSAKTNEEIFSQPATSSYAFLKHYGFSEQIIANFFRPFFGGVFLENELSTSSNFLQFVFKQFAVSDAVLPSAGIQAIPAQLAARLPAESIRKNSIVEAIQGQKIYLSDGQQLEADTIVLAVDAAAATDLIPVSQKPSFNTTSCLYFAAPHSPLDTPMLVINSNVHNLINNMCVPSDIAPGYAPRDQSLISVSIVKQHSFSAIDLINKVKKELSEWFGTQVDQWKHLKTYHIPQALPAYTAEDDAAKTLTVSPNLYRCGDYTAYPSLNAAMQTGREVATIVAEKIRGKTMSK